VRLSPIAVVVAPLAVATALAGAISYPNRSPCIQSYGAFSGSPNHDTLGPDGAIWATEGNADLIARFDPDTKKVTREIRVPRGTQLHDLVTGPDGNLWYAGMNNSLGKVDIHTGQVTPYQGLVGAGNPHIWFAPNGRGYVGEVDAGRLASFDPRSRRPQITSSQFNLPPNSGIHSFAQVADGSTWWGLGNLDELAHFNLSENRFDRFVKLKPRSGPHWLAYVPSDHAIWIALEYSNQIGRFDLRSGQVSYLRTNIPPAAPQQFQGFKLFAYLTQMYSDASGQELWFGTLGGREVLRLDVRSRKLTSVTCGLDPGFLATTIVFTRDSAGRLWVTEPFDKKLGLVAQ
jgi:streptogramin lyase